MIASASAILFSSVLFSLNITMDIHAPRSRVNDEFNTVKVETAMSIRMYAVNTETMLERQVVAPIFAYCLKVKPLQFCFVAILEMKRIAPQMTNKNRLVKKNMDSACASVAEKNLMRITFAPPAAKIRKQNSMVLRLSCLLVVLKYGNTSAASISNTDITRFSVHGSLNTSAPTSAEGIREPAVVLKLRSETGFLDKNSMVATRLTKTTTV